LNPIFLFNNFINVHCIEMKCIYSMYFIDKFTLICEIILTQKPIYVP